MENDDFAPPPPPSSGSPPPRGAQNPPPPGAQTPPGSPQQPQPGTRGTLLYRYNRYKLAARWLLRAVFLLIFGYGILIILSQRTPQSAIDPSNDNSRLGPGMAVSGSIVALTHRNGRDRELLVSRDSGRTFFRAAGQPMMLDTPVFLGVAPDSQTVFALEPNGDLHYLPAGSNQFRVTHIRADSAFNGFAFVPKTDSLYAYGNFPEVYGLRWEDPASKRSVPLPFVTRIRSMAFNTTREAAVIGTTPGNKRPALYLGRPLTEIKPYDIPDKDSTPTPFPPGRNFHYRSTGFSPERGWLYATYLYATDYYLSPRERIRYIADTLDADLIAQNVGHSDPVIADNGLMTDTAGAPIYYGNGPYIQRDTVLDSIPNNGDILAIGLIQGQPRWALAANNGKRYLYQKTGGAWTLNPVLIHPPSWPSLENYTLFLILCLMALTGFVSSVALRLSGQIATRIPNTVNELLTKSEKPLGLHDPDLLGFSSIEEAITKIIRNPQLDLPMTVVISGTWGSGKSSMMNRIRDRLQQTPGLRRRFMTTWFNAWHLQGEPSLLNSFLLNIIGCYENNYPMFSPFRTRIFSRRFLRLPLWKIFGIGFAALLILPFVLLVFLKMLNVQHLRSWEWVDTWCSILANIFLSGKDLNLQLLNPIGAGAIILVSFFFLHRQFIPAGLSAFFELLPKGNFKLDVEKADIGSREKFRQQYWEIMQASPPGTRLVVFIDDLDRVGGDKILELLEGINFISDTASRPPDAAGAQPNTIFVLGMYTQEVARLVGTKLKEVNKASLPEDVLGNLYIEKMVQLIVPVPFNSDDQMLVKKLYEN